MNSTTRSDLFSYLEKYVNCPGKDVRKILFGILSACHEVVEEEIELKNEDELNYSSFKKSFENIFNNIRCNQQFDQIFHIMQEGYSSLKHYNLKDIINEYPQPDIVRNRAGTKEKKLSGNADGTKPQKRKKSSSKRNNCLFCK